MPTPVGFSFTIRDALGTETSTKLYGTATDAALITDVASEWEAEALLMDAIIDGQIVHGTVSFPVKMVAGKAAPVADGRVEQTGIFNLSDTTSTRRNGFDIPSIADAKLLAGKINLADAAVAAFWTSLTVAGGVVRFTNAYGLPLNTLIDALLSFRRHQRSLARSSFEVALP